MMEVVDDLRNKYTYDIIEGNSEKRPARIMLGNAAAEILEKMSEELIDAGFNQWKEYQTVRGIGEAGNSGITIPQEISSKKIEKSSENLV